MKNFRFYTNFIGLSSKILSYILLSRGGINFYIKNFQTSEILIEFLSLYRKQNASTDEHQMFREENMFCTGINISGFNLNSNNSLLEENEDSQINRIFINSKSIHYTSQNLVNSYLFQLKAIFDNSFYVKLHFYIVHFIIR